MEENRSLEITDRNTQEQLLDDAIQDFLDHQLLFDSCSFFEGDYPHRMSLYACGTIVLFLFIFALIGTQVTNAIRTLPGNVSSILESVNLIAFFLLCFIVVVKTPDSVRKREIAIRHLTDYAYDNQEEYVKLISRHKTILSYLKPNERNLADMIKIKVLLHYGYIDHLSPCNVTLSTVPNNHQWIEDKWSKFLYDDMYEKIDILSEREKKILTEKLNDERNINQPIASRMSSVEFKKLKLVDVIKSENFGYLGYPDVPVVENKSLDNADRRFWRQNLASIKLLENLPEGMEYYSRQKDIEYERKMVKRFAERRARLIASNIAMLQGKNQAEKVLDPEVMSSKAITVADGKTEENTVSLADNSGTAKQYIDKLRNKAMKVNDSQVRTELEKTAELLEELSGYERELHVTCASASRMYSVYLPYLCSNLDNYIRLQNRIGEEETEKFTMFIRTLNDALENNIIPEILINQTMDFTATLEALTKKVQSDELGFK